MRLRAYFAFVPLVVGGPIALADEPRPPDGTTTRPREIAQAEPDFPKLGSFFDLGKEERSRRGKGPPTLFEWAIGPKLDDEKDEPPTRMPNDTPHFTDNSRVVGFGRVMLESGYTFTTDRAFGTRTFSHSVPEELLRVGIFADWFEARFEWNYLMTGTSAPRQVAPDGAEDLSVGMRLALTEQKGWLPESALNLAISLPTGSSAFTANRILPEVRYHYSWELVKDKLELEANTIGYSAVEDFGHEYLVFVQSANFEYSLTKEAELFFECYGLFPHGARSPVILPQYYYHSGVTYFFTAVCRSFHCSIDFSSKRAYHAVDNAPERAKSLAV
jgi:hypothetical protein